MASRIRHKADCWCICGAPTRGRILLQFYGKRNEKEDDEEDWQGQGLFFIITAKSNHGPPFEYKLGGYDKAKNSGLFIISNNMS